MTNSPPPLIQRRRDTCRASTARGVEFCRAGSDPRRRRQCPGPTCSWQALATAHVTVHASGARIAYPFRAGTAFHRQSRQLSSPFEEGPASAIGSTPMYNNQRQPSIHVPCRKSPI